APARGRGAAITGWVAMALILAVVVGGGIFAKERIVATWPPAAKLYDMIGLPVADPGYGLEPRNVASAQEMDGDVPVLVVSGEVVNTSGETRAVPRLRGALLDVREREIFFWVFATANATLAAGEVTPFSTRVPNPPTNARRIAGTFVKAE
ncbi:MAG: DUF3426 domain-containing protein, partial [Alphaproteobacteria bacterium]|nr:DUF3426 domain-containing protein [Alphaproteobacteria bacterium]